MCCDNMAGAWYCLTAGYVTTWHTSQSTVRYKDTNHEEWFEPIRINDTCSLIVAKQTDEVAS